MTWPELQALIARGEAEHVEFKPSMLSRKETAESCITCHLRPRAGAWQASKNLKKTLPVGYQLIPCGRDD